MNAEVVERCQVVLVDGVPETEFGGDASVEVTQYVEAIGSLGRGGEAKELPRLHSSQEGFVGRSGCVVELVDDHDVEVAGVDRLDAAGLEALDRGEDMLELRRAITTDPFLAEGGVAEGVSERRPALVKDLFAVATKSSRSRGSAMRSRL